jgi:hypothetical protein
MDAFTTIKHAFVLILVSFQAKTNHFFLNKKSLIVIQTTKIKNQLFNQ